MQDADAKADVVDKKVVEMKQQSWLVQLLKPNNNVEQPNFPQEEQEFLSRI